MSTNFLELPSSDPAENRGSTVLTTSGLFATLPLAACGGGDDSAATGPGQSQSENAQLGTPLTPAQAARFLSQAQLFATSSSIEQVVEQGYQAWLNAQFNTPVEQTAWDWLYEKGYNAEEFKPRIALTDYFCWKDLLSAPDALRKRIALVLSEIMVVSIPGVPGNHGPFFMAAYWDILNQHAFGNFRDLLENITLNPAMGKYLNMVGSVKGSDATGRQPDENYAREIMQLFTIGLYELNPDASLKLNGSGAPVETYSQDDVTNLARVFTGWNLDQTGVQANQPLFARTPMKHVPAQHATDEAHFLNTTIAQNTPGEQALSMALDTLFMHPNVAPFWAKQMILKMVTSNPSPAYIQRVAKVFENNGQGVRGDLKAVVKSILLDPEARGAVQIDNPSVGKLREPIARLIQWARTFNASTANDDWIFNATVNAATQLGQSPLRSPSVFNFFRPGYVPADPAFAANNLVGPEFQLLNEVTVAGYINFMTSLVANGMALKAKYDDWLVVAENPDQLVQQLVLLLAANQIPETTQREIASAVLTIAPRPNDLVYLRRRVYASILLIMACPQYLIQK